MTNRLTSASAFAALFLGAAFFSSSASAQGQTAPATAPAPVAAPATFQLEGVTAQHRSIKVNGINLHYVEAGKGPLLVLVHGFPETWYSWRHQIPYLVKAGYRVVVPDMRGYGESSKPTDVEAYTVSLLVGDLVSLVQAAGEKEAAIIGHDWGGVTSWYAALMRPDMFRAVVVMGAPFTPPMQLPEGVKLLDAVAARSGGLNNYRVAFGTSPDIDAQLNSNVAQNLRAMLYTFSGDVVKDGVRQQGWAGVYPKDQTFTAQLNQPASLPAWLTEADLSVYTQGLGEAGFTPGLSYYRNLNRLPALLAPYMGKPITQPALYMYGEYDTISGNTEDALKLIRASVPGLKDIVQVAGKGHWLQQEAPQEVNETLRKFLRRYAMIRRSSY